MTDRCYFFVLESPLCALESYLRQPCLPLPNTDHMDASALLIQTWDKLFLQVCKQGTEIQDPMLFSRLLNGWSGDKGEEYNKEQEDLSEEDSNKEKQNK